MVNGVDIAVGGISGAAFGLIVDGAWAMIQNAAEYTASHANIKSTLEALKPLVIEMKEKNTKLYLPDEELKGLKEEMEKDGKRLEELSEQSVRNYFMRPFDNMELDEMNKSLQRLLGILQVQTGRDVKEVLVQVKGISEWNGNTTNQLGEVASNGKETLDYTKRILDRVERMNGFSGFVPISEKDCKEDANKILSQLDDCKTEIVDVIPVWGGKTADQLDQVTSSWQDTLKLANRIFYRLQRSTDLVSIREERAFLVERDSLRLGLLRLGSTVDEALSKPNPHSGILEVIKEAIQRCHEGWMLADDDIVNPKCFMTFDELKTFMIKVEEGTELIRECSNVALWTDHNKDIYASKLDDFAKFLEASVQRSKRINSTRPKGFDTQNFCSPSSSVPCN